jgi:Cu2+-exporting ATPase
VTELVFDKTGTLTLETPVLKNPEALRALDAQAREALLALVCDNPHPVSACLHACLLVEGVTSPKLGNVEETPGCGTELDGWSLGRAGWRATGTAGGDATLFAQRGVVLAEFQFAHSLRPDAHAELLALRRGGFRVRILSGDSRENVARTAAELELSANDAFAELTPQGKAEWFDAYAPDNALMLGDGVNDSLAFDRALCRGTPVVHRGVLEKKADFYYLGNGIAGIRALFAIDDVRRRTQFAILLFSVAYNLFAVGLAVAGKINPLVAAVLMPVNSLLTLAIVGIGMRPARETGVSPDGFYPPK